MRDCKGGCGLRVLDDGAEFCTSCQIKNAAEAQRQSVQSQKTRRTFELLSVKITVIGFESFVHVYEDQRPTSWSATGLRSIAALMNEAADYVGSLTYEWTCELCGAPCNFACPVCAASPSVTPAHPKPRCPGCYRLGHERGAL
jgi:hypothetical protein